jgi:hypothetical protein
MVIRWEGQYVIEVFEHLGGDERQKTGYRYFDNRRLVKAPVRFA